MKLLYLLYQKTKEKSGYGEILKETVENEAKEEAKVKQQMMNNINICSGSKFRRILNSSEKVF